MYIIRIASANGVACSAVVGSFRDLAAIAAILERAKQKFKVIDDAGDTLSQTDFGFAGYDGWLEKHEKLVA
jgi:hypothetical protein